MKTLQELLNIQDSAWPIVQDLAQRAIRPVELLPPSHTRAEVLLQIQVTTRSPLGAIAYETGGILVDYGWLRLLGSGHPKLTRTLPGWNTDRANGFYLVADDAIGGFFALNGGTLGDDIHNLYYFAPDTLDWFPMKIGYTDFLHWVCLENMSLFYKNFRWPSWASDMAALQTDRCMMTFPPLWMEDGWLPSAQRRQVPVTEAWEMQMDFRDQLNTPRDLSDHNQSI